MCSAVLCNGEVSRSEWYETEPWAAGTEVETVHETPEITLNS